MLRGARFVSLIPLACLLVYSNVTADERLPAYLIRLPESVETVFFAETTTAEKAKNGITRSHMRHQTAEMGGYF